ERGNSFRRKGNNRSRTRLNPQSRLHGRRNNIDVVEGLTSRSPVEPGRRAEGTGLGLRRAHLVVGRSLEWRFRRQLLPGPRAFALVVKSSICPCMGKADVGNPMCIRRRFTTFQTIEPSFLPSFSIFSPSIPGTGSGRAGCLSPP